MGSLSAIGLYRSHIESPESCHEVDIFNQNIEALSDIEQIGDNWYIVDNIPCASEATEYRVDHSYVNCTTCAKEFGKAHDTSGSCTNVRPLGI